MENNKKLLLWLTLFCCSFSAHGFCRTTFTEDQIIKTTQGSRTPNLQQVFQNFFQNFRLDDKCISTHNQKFWDFQKSMLLTNTTGATTSRFDRYYFSKSDGTIRYSSSGFFEKVTDNDYISWNAQGGIPGGTQTGPRSGRIYILNIQSQRTDWTGNTGNNAGTVITYYSCFDGNEIINENIYIVQANGGTKQNREINLAAAKTYVKGATFPIDGLSDVTCY